MKPHGETVLEPGEEFADVAISPPLPDGDYKLNLTLQTDGPVEVAVVRRGPKGFRLKLDPPPGEQGRLFWAVA